MAAKIKSLQAQLAQQEGSCCCEELRQIHNEKEVKLNQITDTWKNKTYNLAGKYFKTLQTVREEHTKLQLQTYESIDRLRLYQQSVVNQIMAKQDEIVINYEEKLRRAEKENKQLQRRLVQLRNQR